MGPLIAEAAGRKGSSFKTGDSMKDLEFQLKRMQTDFLTQLSQVQDQLRMIN